MQRTTRPQHLSRFGGNPNTLLLLIIGLLMLSVSFVSSADPAFGTITTTNSIIGGNASDRIGIGGVVELPSGNILLISPFWNGGMGAVTCLTPAQYKAGGIVVSAINSLTGDSAGSGGVTVLSNGNYVVRSTSITGAITWGNGSTCSTNNTVISASNSLVGSHYSNPVGNSSVVALPNGNYVVSSSVWTSSSSVSYAGAVRWCDGTIGCTGYINEANSLFGSTEQDRVGGNGVTALPNGNYLVGSPSWDNGALADVGAVTWCDGTTGCIGPVSAANSFIGNTDVKSVGGVKLLANGKYLVTSATTHTLCDWSTPCTGTVSLASSWVLPMYSYISSITLLPTGNYVVVIANWDNGAIADVGAVRLCNGTTGCTGTVSASNSLIGSTSQDNVGSLGVKVLTNGNYVVNSSSWDNGSTINAGAVTWCDGTTGCTGTVSASNSLVGTTGADSIGHNGVTVLTNGNYVVNSTQWDNGAIVNAGAVTWCNGTTGCTGAVSTSNSLVGSTNLDTVGSSGVTVLTNGNYVVNSSSWDNGSTIDAGAVTWCDGATGCAGISVSSLNSLVGTVNYERVGYPVNALTNGHYVVSSPNWENAAALRVGAVRWCNGTTGCTGTFSAANSLVGSSYLDNVGMAVTGLIGGNYVVMSIWWDGLAENVGAATWGNGLGGTVGVVSAANSLVGSSAQDGLSLANTSMDGRVAPLSDGKYLVILPAWDNGGTANVGSVTYGDWELIPPSVTASETVVSATEGGETDSYTVVLASQPTADVTITLTGDAQVTTSSTLLTFTAANWYIPQTVTVTAVDDAVDENAYTGTITHSVSATGGYTGVTAADVTVNITDNDTPGVTVSETAVSATEGGETGSYTVVLNSEPTADVTVTITGDAQASVSPTSLTFTSADWDDPQTVTVTAVDDAGGENAHTGTITHSVSETGGYTGVTVDDVTVNITDNDTPGVTVSETAVSATEGGETGSYTVVLNSEPTADVTITITGDAQASVNPTSLTFTMSDWDDPQTVTVTAVDDAVGENAHTGTITHSVSETGGYTGVIVASVTVNITDDEIAAVSTELLTNGGFETGGATAGIPLGWTITKPSGDKRACPLALTHIHDGLCAFKFTGSSIDASKLTQTVNLTGVTFAAGDTLTASAFFKGNHTTAKIKVRLLVYYTGNSTPVKTSLTVLRNATYTQHSLAVYTLTSGGVDQIKLQFNHFSNAGTIWVDDVSLVHTVPAVISRDGAVLDMPSAPEGFRK